MTVLHPLRSSMLSTLGYNPDTETLIAQFNTGQFYKYTGVPADVFVGVVTNAESHGRAFNELVKGADFHPEKIDATDVAIL